MDRYRQIRTDNAAAPLQAICAALPCLDIRAAVGMSTENTFLSHQCCYNLMLSIHQPEAERLSPPFF